LMEQEYDTRIDHAVKKASFDSGKIYDLLATFFKECGRNVLTEKYFRRAVELRSAEFGDDSKEAEESRFNLASLKWWIQGDYAAAESLFAKSLHYREKQFGRKNTETAKIMYYLGTLHQLQARYNEAESLFREAIEIIEAQRGKHHPDLAPALNKLAALFLEKGNYSSAEPLYREAYEICGNALGKD